MADELSLRAVRQFMLRMGGTVRNKDIVRHFKNFLNEPNTKTQAREQFKEYMNMLSSIKAIEGERLLVLKPNFEVTHQLPVDASSEDIHLQCGDSLKREEEKQIGLSPAQEACAQAIASARAIQELLGGPDAISPRPKQKSKSKLPRFVMGETTIEYTGDQESTPTPPPHSMSPTDFNFDDRSSSSSEEAHKTIMKSVAVPKGPSQSIRHKAEALEKLEDAKPTDIDIENVGSVMETVAARAAALGEKLDHAEIDSPDGGEDGDESPSRSRVAAAVLNINRSAGEKLDTALVRPQQQHRAPATRSERTRALKETFVGKMPSPVLEGVRSRAHTMATVQRSPVMGRRLGDGESSGGGSIHQKAGSPPVGGVSPILSRSSVGHRTERRHGLHKKKDSKTERQTSTKSDKMADVKESVHPGGSDGEYSDDGDDDQESSHEYSHIALDPMEREWLMVASEANYSHVSQMLQRNSTMVNKKDFINGYTALHWAVKQDKTDTVKLLFDFHADPALKTHAGQTALHLAAKFGRNAIIATLVNGHKVNVYVRDHAGKQARDIASDRLTEECKALIDYKEVEQSQTVNETPLKQSGSFSADSQDGFRKPSRSKIHFSPGILRDSFRKLRGKDKKKDRPVIIHAFSKPSWTDEPDGRSPSGSQHSTSEGDLTRLE